MLCVETLQGNSMTALTLNLDPITRLTHAQFRELCQANPELKLERTAEGELIVMPPTGWESGKRNSALTGQLWAWNEQTGFGIAFDSSTGFALPSGAVRSPDAAWVRKDRLDKLNPDPDGFLPLAPDFVIELRSATDRLKPLQEKMREYQANGVRLGWLLNPKERAVEIYRLGQAVEVVNLPSSLSAEDVLPGFVLEMKGIFD
jgi:Uma2 family endonuclease